jgi:hypothetical protein
MQKKGSILLLIALAGLLLWLRFPDFFEYGNSRFIEPWGDGYKAYHAIFYHLDYDSTYSHFEGMNYPYGEHVVPGACEPFFSNGLRFLQSIGINVRPYGLGIFHGFLLFSMVLSAVFLYLIFERLKLPHWYSILLALGIGGLAPQMERLISHYGLAHPELLPLLFYLLLRWHEQINEQKSQSSWGWSALIGLTVLIYSGIHFYYFAILSFAIVGWVAVRWLLQRDWAATLQYIGHGFLMLGLPFLFYYAWMLYPDTVTDRNPVPWGFFNYRSRLGGIFTDLSQPYWQWIDEHLVSVYRPNIEAQAYIGLVATAFMIYFLIKLLGSVFRRWPLTVTNSREQYLKYLLISSIGILLFAHGIPFIFPYGEKLLSHSGPLQQFRSIGRFAWVFYYAANISAFYYLYQWSQKQQKQGIKTVILALPLLLLGFESYHYNTSKPIDLDKLENWEAGEYFTDLPIDYERYQACLPIPYFNIGSDNFWLPAIGWIGQKPHTLSMQTGLPLTSAMLTRTSLRQTINQLQLVTEPYRLPAIFADYPNDKPLLLFWDNERVNEHGDIYTHLRDGTILLHKKDWLYLYELPLGSFQDRIDDKKRSVLAQADSLFQRSDGYLLSDSTAHFLRLSYDDNPKEDAYFGRGEFVGQMAYWNRLADTIWQSNYSGELTVSFWMYLNSDRAPRATISWKEYDVITGDLLFEQERVCHQSVRLFDDQGWGLIEFSLPRQRSDSRIELIVRNDDQKEGPLRIDELLIRPQSLDVARHYEDGIWWNNRFYPNR